MMKSNETKAYTVILAKKMTGQTGIFKIVLVYEGSGGRYGGLMHKSMAATADPQGVFYMKSKSCSIYQKGFWCGGKEVCNGQNFCGTQDKLTVSLELDLSAHTLSFFANENQLPHCVENVPPSVHFAFVLWPQLHVEVASFQQLAAPTTDRTMRCTRYPWE